MTNIIHFQKNVHANDAKVLYYHTIYISKDVNVQKTSASKECINCHYWRLVEEGSRFQEIVTKCHDAIT